MPWSQLGPIRGGGLVQSLGHMATVMSSVKALVGQGWVSWGDVTVPGRFQLLRAECQPPSTFILGSQSSIQEAHQSIALGSGMRTDPTGGTVIPEVGDKNFLGVVQPWLIPFPALPWKILAERAAGGL